MGYVRGGNDTCVDIDECANGEMCTGEFVQLGFVSFQSLLSLGGPKHGKL